MKKILLPLALVLTTASGVALADQTGPYVGASLGNATTDLKADHWEHNYDENVVAYGLYGGYNFTENLGLEATLGQTGEQDNIKKGYATLTPRVMMPINDQLSLFAKAGVAYVAVDGDYDGIDNMNRHDIDVDGFGWTAGAGVNFAVAEHIDLRAGIDYLSTDLEKADNDKDLNIDSETTMYYVGVNYNF
ncbi:MULTISPECIES: outer membrane protein [unclassified Photobacterium]|uniref:outer membrane protein n=1 Tax=unclassified Photobacterium TaxID=2628852 RepID=UPI000D171BC9|nr:MULTISPECIES: porin family protein [unclassified Photobacterium]PSV52446.1 porin family protein [Photobacterium sp. GB-1]PSV54339.1 porin family protein [Photobacterium sp. GB-3]